MTDAHRIVAIVPARDMEASTAFYARLGLELVSDWGDYRILSDGRGWNLHLTRTTAWPAQPEDNPLGLYVYVDDVDGAAARMGDLVLAPHRPELKPWGCYEFAVSDPAGTLVRIGRIVD
ncbi:MAG: VOC family protein [Alphaproteobacteria bacterium]|nr:VOC family protein [Alphaproteobacteria bacterium]MBU1526565.1 VOC family protein [Alphaproteobacteria bacterium]MBU2351534.1 VOC family protein [Alphaproteobacteria bacterium]MBU2381341.1 VOC family protein [Alphaproteobacteria bacterium]